MKNMQINFKMKNFISCIGQESGTKAKNAIWVGKEKEVCYANLMSFY